MPLFWHCSYLFTKTLFAFAFNVPAVSHRIHPYCARHTVRISSRPRSGIWIIGKRKRKKSMCWGEADFMEPNCNNHMAMTTSVYLCGSNETEASGNRKREMMKWSDKKGPYQTYRMVVADTSDVLVIFVPLKLIESKRGFKLEGHALLRLRTAWTQSNN